MIRRVVSLVSVVLFLCLFVRADEPAKPDPRYQRAVASLQKALGAGFTVDRVGMFVAAFELDPERTAQFRSLIGRLETTLYRDIISRRPNYIIRIVLFKDNASLQTNAKKILQKSPLPGPGGFYFEYERAVLADGSMGEWLLRHELTHALLQAEFGVNKPAPWMHEGLASLFETASVEEDLVFHPDWRLGTLIKLKDVDKLPHLEDVLKLDFRNYYTKPADRQVSDTVGAGFLFYLHQKGLLAEFCKRYRGDFSADPTGIKFAEQVLKKKIHEIESDWLVWLSEQAPQLPRPVRPGPEKPEPPRD